MRPDERIPHKKTGNISGQFCWVGPLRPVMCLNDGISFLGDVNARRAERTVPSEILTKSEIFDKTLPRRDALIS